MARAPAVVAPVAAAVTRRAADRPWLEPPAARYDEGGRNPRKAVPSPYVAVQITEADIPNGLTIAKRGAFQVAMRGQSLGDAELRRWCGQARMTLLRMKSASPSLYANSVDFAENRISAAGARELMQLFLDLKIGIVALHLHRNRIGPEAAPLLAEYIRECPQALEELHLSHNLLDRSSVSELVKAYMCAGSAGRPRYPCRTIQRRCKPAWLRIEFNRIANAQEFISEAAEVHFKRLRDLSGFRTKPSMKLLCPAPDGCGCRSASCGFQQEEFGPVVHMPFIRPKGPVERPHVVEPPQHQRYVQPGYGEGGAARPVPPRTGAATSSTTRAYAPEPRARPPPPPPPPPPWPADGRVTQQHLLQEEQEQGWQQQRHHRPRQQRQQHWHSMPLEAEPQEEPLYPPSGLVPPPRHRGGDPHLRDHDGDVWGRGSPEPEPAGEGVSDEESPDEDFRAFVARRRELYRGEPGDASGGSSDGDGGQRGRPPAAHVPPPTSGSGPVADEEPLVYI